MRDWDPCFVPRNKKSIPTVSLLAYQKTGLGMHYTQVEILSNNSSQAVLILFHYGLNGLSNPFQTQKQFLQACYLINKWTLKRHGLLLVSIGFPLELPFLWVATQTSRLQKQHELVFVDRLLTEMFTVCMHRQLSLKSRTPSTFR